MSKATKDHIMFLENLEQWGVKNIDAAAPYLRQQFPTLSLIEAREVVSYWMNTRNQLLNEAR